MLAVRPWRGLLLAALALMLLTATTFLAPDLRLRRLTADEPVPVILSPKYKPTPTYVPPPVKDPFPSLKTSQHAPSVPAWNLARADLHKSYGLAEGPALLIGFTRTYPLLLQCVVSYITAGWPASQIYVVENTGVQQSNAQGNLTLQNPRFLDHAALKKLGVNIVMTPTLLSFAQLQNFFLSLSHQHGWERYFWSHMDVFALSLEGGEEGVTPRFDEPGYKSLYELALIETNKTLTTTERWSMRLFAYDHLTLVNRAAYDDVGGWDVFIPYYMTDCDMYTRLEMAGWSRKDVRAGHITDVSSVLDDLRALYRDWSVIPAFTDPNPPPLPTTSEGTAMTADTAAEKPKLERIGDGSLGYWEALLRTSDAMLHYKHGARGRNTWQLGQRGGLGEPYYYPADGLAEGIDVLTKAGKTAYALKWGHRDCDLPGLKLGDQWRVEKDWVE